MKLLILPWQTKGNAFNLSYGDTKLHGEDNKL